MISHETRRAAPARRSWRRILLIVALLAVAAGATALTALSLREHRSPVALVAEAPIPAPEQLFGTEFVRVLLVGLDYDYDEKDQETSAHSRSDIIMAIGLDTAKHKITELSVPRDMVAVLPDGRRAKINQAQSDGGIAESQTVVAQWLGIPGFDRYVVLRINATKDLIDAVGGIDLTVQNADALMHQGPNGPLDYDDSWGHLHVHLRPGFQHLDGEHAVGYARFRHDWCSDPCRIMRQQQVARAMAERLKNDKLNTLLHISALLGVLRRDVQTNLSTEEEVSLAYAFRNASAADIKAAQVPYVRDVDLPGYGSALVPDDARKTALANALLMPPAAPRDEAQPKKGPLR